MPIPYHDSGYHGGTYWAILPKGTTRKEAKTIFNSEGHMTTLQAIGWDEIIDDCLSSEVKETLRGIMLKYFNGNI